MAKPAQRTHSGHYADENLRAFDQSLPISLLRAREAVLRQFIPFLREHGLSPEQWRVIRALELEDGLELADLAQRCFLLAPSLSRIARNLEQRKLVTRHNVARDQRRSTLFLTDAGKVLFDSIAPESLEQYADIRDKFGTEKLTLLYQLLDDLVELLGNDQEEVRD